MKKVISRMKPRNQLSREKERRTQTPGAKDDLISPGRDPEPSGRTQAGAEGCVSRLPGRRV